MFGGSGCAGQATELPLNILDSSALMNMQMSTAPKQMTLGAAGFQEALVLPLREDAGTSEVLSFRKGHRPWPNSTSSFLDLIS